MNKSVFFKYSLIPTLAILLFLSVGCVQEHQKTEMTHEKLVERGKFLVAVGGCTDCHTPKVFGPQGPQPDTTRFLAGYPAENPLPQVDMNLVQPGKWVLFTQDITGAVGPWGASFAANLTPDNETGLGTWQLEMFVNAMRTGKHLGAGRLILPPMPWENVGKLSDEDLSAIFNYLKSIKPVKNKVPDPLSPDQLVALK
jgi:mono/diheme cytochrome c family protein